MRTVWVNVETRVFHSTGECPIARVTSQRRIQQQSGDGSDISHGLRCRVCHTQTGDPR